MSNKTIIRRLYLKYLESLCLILALLYTKNPNFKWSAIRVSVLLAIQIGLGISNVVFSLPLVVAVAHNLVAAFLLVSILHVNYQLWHKKAFDDVNTPQFISKESSQ